MQERKEETKSETRTLSPPAPTTQPAPPAMRDPLSSWKSPKMPNSLAIPGLDIGLKKKMKWEFCSWILSKDPSAGDKPGISGKLVNPLPPRILPCPSSWLSWNSRWARYWDSTGRGKTDKKKLILLCNLRWRLAVPCQLQLPTWWSQSPAMLLCFTGMDGWMD